MTITFRLDDLQDGQLHLDSEDIAGVLNAQGIDETDCGFTGLLEIADESGWNNEEIWATKCSRPFDATASYTLIWAGDKLAPVTDWPGFEGP